MENTTKSNVTFPSGSGLFPMAAIDVYNVYLYFIIVTGVFGNMLVLVVFKAIRPTSSTDWFVIFITISDFVSSLANVPVYATFTNGAWKHYGNNVLCKTHMFISQSIVLSSTFFICGLAFDRYMKVCRPGGKRLNTKAARNVCLIICLAAFVLSTPSLLIFKNIDNQCKSATVGKGMLVYYTFVFLTFITAFVIVVFSYTKISATVKKSEQNVSRHGPVYRRDVPGSSWLCCAFAFLGNRVVPVASDGNGHQRYTGCEGRSLFGASSDHTRKEDNKESQRTTTLSSTCNTEIDRRVQGNASTDIAGQSSENRDVYSISYRKEEIAPEVMQARTTQRSMSVNVYRQSTRTTKISFFVCSIFIISWIPPWLSLFVLAVPEMRLIVHVQMFVLFGKMTYLLNTVTNPFVYAFLNRKFRSKVVKILCFWKK